MYQLSTGEIAKLNAIEGSSTIQQPLTLQIFSNIQPFGNQTPTRYRCMVTDGADTAVAVLSSNMTPLIEAHTVARFSVIRINKGNASKKARPNEAPMVFLIINDAELLGTLTEKIVAGPGGAATAVSGAGPSNQSHSFQAPPPPQQQQQPPQYQQPKQQQYKQGASFMSRVEDTKPDFNTYVAPVHTGPTPILHPIGDLNPYHNKWTIRARVTQKSPIRTWNKPNSQGRLFSVNLLDESSEIRATIFTQQVDKFHPMLDVGKVYFVSNAQVKMARQQFSNLSNQYELTFDDNTVVELCQDQGSAPQEHYDFVQLANLGKFEKNHIMDVLGVVRDAGEVSQITMRNSDRKVSKRELTIVDRSGYQVRLTLWGNEAESFNASGEPVIAFKGARLGDFGGRSLSLPSMGTIVINPDIPEAHALRGWYDSEGRNASFQSYGGSAGDGGAASTERFESQLKTMAQVRDENLGGGEATDYFYVKGTIVYIRTNSIAYPACPGEGCNKKVTEDLSSGQWRCEKCERTYPAPEYRYIFSVNVTDETGQAWLQCFSEVGEKVLGCSANQLVDLQNNNEAAFKEKISEATFKEYKFRCRAKTEVFNDVSRVRLSVMGIYPVDYASETVRLNRLIESFSQAAF
ncbi:Replication factor A protein 1 [Coemansia sp. Benny D115]|nr:Replication factor A protein 1 [Coemansia sp. Benny D115]